MSNENEVVAEETQPQDQNVQISIEQICAAIVNTLGSVTVPLETLLLNYSDKSIAVNQDEETKALTFSLADAPVAEAQETEEPTTENE